MIEGSAGEESCAGELEICEEGRIHVMVWGGGTHGVGKGKVWSGSSWKGSGVGRPTDRDRPLWPPFKKPFWLWVWVRLGVGGLGGEEAFKT